MRFLFLVIIYCNLLVSVFAQDNLFAPKEPPKPKYGFIITGNGNFDIPGGDMAKEFGLSYRAGFGIQHKSKKNWMLGVKFDFILGNLIKDDSFMSNVRDKYNSNFNGKVVEFLANDGTRVGIPLYERGYAVGFEAGKIFPLSKYKPDNGIMELTSFGFMQHKIDIFDKDNVVPQIKGSYTKGYDRLTNGLFIEQYLGFVYFSKSKLVNFHAGFDCLVGFTKCRRGYQYDLMQADNAQRIDVLFGLRGGWYIPMFKRKSEDIMFQ